MCREWKTRLRKNCTGKYVSCTGEQRASVHGDFHFSTHQVKQANILRISHIRGQPPACLNLHQQPIKPNSKPVAKLRRMLRVSQDGRRPYKRILRHSASYRRQYPRLEKPEKPPMRAGRSIFPTFWIMSLSFAGAKGGSPAA
jgi:hypothetical protein